VKLGTRAVCDVGRVKLTRQYGLQIDSEVF
jgi:hypothetical protein